MAFIHTKCEIWGYSISEEIAGKIEVERIKEIHHIVKNNLQVISSLISLQVEKLKNTECIEALKEIQGRITSIALVHEELYRSPDLVTLDFSTYLERMIKYLLDFYRPEKNINLKLNLEKIFIGIDTAIPLAIMLNELIHNSVDYAFPNKSAGEISINLCEAENYNQYLKKYEGFRADSKCQNEKHFQYLLIFKDNGIGFPQDIDFKNTSSLGFQIIDLLVEQIEGCIDLETNKGTKFSIWFSDLSKSPTRNL